MDRRQFYGLEGAWLKLKNPSYTQAAGRHELFEARRSGHSVVLPLDTGTAAGRLVLNIMTAVSQWEREAIGERTRDAMRHKRANGERVGTVPFGFRMQANSRSTQGS